MELMTRWPHCLLHGPGHCYSENGGSHGGQHYPLEPSEWGIWATAMVNKVAVVDYPPRTAAFDAILEGHLKSSKKGSKKGAKTRRRGSLSSDNSESLTDKHRPIIVNVNHPSSLPPPTRRYSNPISSPSKSTVIQRKIPVTDVLQHIAGYQPSDYTDKALKDYLDWLAKRAPGDYDGAFTLLRNHVIGVDILLESYIGDASVLQSQTNIPYGTAARILKDFSEWIDFLESKKATSS